MFSYITNILILLVFIPSLVFGGSLQFCALRTANKDAGYVYELTNNNDSPRINYYNKAVGVPLGSPYCAAAVYTWYAEGALESNTKNPMYRSASTNQLFYNALKNPTRYKLIKPLLVRQGAEKLQTGDISLWSTSSNFSKGHTGFVVEQIDNNTIHTIEANTSSSNILSEQREQDKKSKSKGGVYHKKRNLSPNPKMDIKGFVRAR